MNWRIPLSDLRPSEAQVRAANEVLSSGWLSMGPWTERFEQRFATDLGTPHAVCVSSGTAGLLLALQCHGVGPGDEVVIPSLTFVADANVVRALGAQPVFADIESVDRPIVAADDILAAVGPRTRAVIAVHYAGYLADIEPLLALRERGIAVIEDASHAVGPLTDGGPWLPCVGDFAVFSFFANKNLATGEGGMVTTHNPETDERLRLLRSHGMTTGTWDRHTGHASDYDVVAMGWNFRPQEISAALGFEGLCELAEHNVRRREALGWYHDAFAATTSANQSHRLIFDTTTPTSGHIAVAVLPPGRRDAVRDALRAEGIQSSFHYPPIHRFTAFADVAARPLPHTEAANESLVTLPMHPWLTEDEVREIVQVVVGAG